LQTWHALEKEPMLKVNADLGFLPDREWREYEADVKDLLRRLARAQPEAFRDLGTFGARFRATKFQDRGRDRRSVPARAAL
jgi:hypothetical protein